MSLAINLQLLLAVLQLANLPGSSLWKHGHIFASAGRVVGDSSTQGLCLPLFAYNYISLENVNGNLYWNSTGYFYESCDMGLLTNYYGYLSCFGKIDFDRGTHKWPCKGDDWTPWGSHPEKLGIIGNASLPVPVTARPSKTLFPQFAFVAPNATNTTTATGAGVVTVTINPPS
ncbi:hypothetical protein BR93DRAFT_937508 [Coniochaeta sp. PMI_546]|nr:hypothetical protein BR93DRAFT_937508 [Coniochaeta sp. PMI_546]